MRAGSVSIAVALVLAIAPAWPAEAHHGFNGRYDRSKPLWIAGTITTATYNQPHALINIEPAAPAPPPPDLFDLSNAMYSRLGGKDVVARAQPIAASGGGLLTLLLNPVMTSEIAVRATQPARGQSVGAIVFRECSTGELRVQLLRLSASDVVVRDSARQREVDGCDEPASQTAPPTTPPTVAVAATAQPVPVATRPRADDGSALLLGVAAALAAALALGIGLVLARRGAS